MSLQSIRYKLILQSNLILTADENEIILSEIGEYSVHDQYSQTLSRERKLVENLTNEISEMIVLTLIKY